MPHIASELPPWYRRRALADLDALIARAEDDARRRLLALERSVAAGEGPGEVFEEADQGTLLAALSATKPEAAADARPSSRRRAEPSSGASSRRSASSQPSERSTILNTSCAANPSITT